MSYEEAIDHVLFGHIEEQMKKRGFEEESRIYACIYYLHAKGGLTACDILKAMKASKLPNSELFKQEFVEMVYPPEESESENPLNLDASVLEQVQLTLKAVRDKVDTEFYESAAKHLVKKSDKKEAAEEQQEAETNIEEVDASQEQS